MKKAFLMIVLMFIATFSIGQTLSKKEVKTKLRDYVSSNYDNPKKVRIQSFRDYDGRLYQASLVSRNLTSAVMMNDKGEVIEKHKEIVVCELPSNIKDKFPKARYDYIIKVDEIDTGNSYYHLSYKEEHYSYDITIDTNGTILEFSKNNDRTNKILGTIMIGLIIYLSTTI